LDVHGRAVAAQDLDDSFFELAVVTIDRRLGDRTGMFGVAGRSRLDWNAPETGQLGE
jgi:hypothetical protein